MNEVIEILKRVGGVIDNDHFVFTSGRHSAVYLNKDAIYPHTAEISRVGELMAERHRDLPIDVVVGPALGGIIISQWTAHHFSLLRSSSFGGQARLAGREVLGVYT